METQERIKELEAEIERLKKELKDPMPWMPEPGEKFWVCTANDVYRFSWDGGETNMDLFNSFNLFPTQEAAEAEAERTRIRRELQWMAQQGEKEEGYWYVIQYNGSEFVVSKYEMSATMIFFGTIRFNTQEWAQKAIDKFGKKLLKV